MRLESAEAHSVSSKPGPRSPPQTRGPSRGGDCHQTSGYMEVEEQLLGRTNGGGGPDLHPQGRAGEADMAQWLDKFSSWRAYPWPRNSLWPAFTWNEDKRSGSWKIL